MATVMVCDICDRRLLKGHASQFTVTRKQWYMAFLHSPFFGSSYSEKIICCDDCVKTIKELSLRKNLKERYTKLCREGK